MKIFLVLFVMFFSVAVSNAEERIALQGSGRVISEIREISDFSALEVHGAFTVELTTGKKVGCTIRGDDNIVKIVHTDVSGGRLRVFTTQSYISNSILHLLLTVPSLKEITTSGANLVHAVIIKENTLSLHMDGSSTFAVEGQALQLNSVLAGGATLNADRLVAERVNIEITGTGDANVHATGTLNVVINGVGSVRYLGKPVITRDIRGVGDVSPK